MKILKSLSLVLFLAILVPTTTPNLAVAKSNSSKVDSKKNKKTTSSSKKKKDSKKSKKPKSSSSSHTPSSLANFAQRDSDLSKNITNSLSDHTIPIRGFRVLVLNCGTGDLCNSIANKQIRTAHFGSEKARMKVHGVDSSGANIRKANQGRGKKQYKASFARTDANFTYLKKIRKNEYDIIIAQDMGTTFRKHNREWEKRFVASLAEKARIVFVELDAKHNTKKTPACFASCPNYQVSNVTPRQGAGSAKPKALFKLLKRKFTIDGKRFRADQTITEFRSCKNRISRMGDRVYIKEYIKDPKGNSFPYLERAEREIAFYQYAKQHKFTFIPLMRAHELTDDRIILAVDRVPGQQVFKAYAGLNNTKKKKLIVSLLKAMVEFDKHKISHGDFSTKNMIWNPKTEKVSLIDFDSTEFGKRQNVNLMLALFEELRRNSLMPRVERARLARKGVKASDHNGFMRNMVNAIQSGKAKNHKDLLRIIS